MLLKDILTEEEIKKFDELKPHFNRVREDRAPLVVSSYRVEVSKKMGNKILFAAAILNILTILCIVTAGIVLANKPAPDYYAATQSGNIYGPLPKIHPN